MQLADEVRGLRTDNSVRAAQLEQCRMIGRMARGLKVSPVATDPDALDSPCARAAREEFTTRPVAP